MVNLSTYILATVALCQGTAVLSRQVDFDNIIFPTEDENGRLLVPPLPQTTAKTFTTTGTTTTTAAPEYTKCINSCLVTQQYNPVCGTNRRTFGNENKLKCAQLCGLDVKVLHIGACRRPGSRK